MPWGHPGEHHDFEPQRHDDGYLEVIGFTMTSLVSDNLSPSPELSLPFPSRARGHVSCFLWPKVPWPLFSRWTVTHSNS